MDIDQDRRDILTAHDALVAEGHIELLSRDRADVRVWSDCMLAGMIENRFFVDVDPRAFTPEMRANWKRKAVSREERIPEDAHENDWFRRPYWLMHQGKRAGAVGLATTVMGPRTVEVTTLYVMPAYRRQGIATRFLRRAYEAVCAQGINGLSISAHWAWQPAVRFCLGAGAWVYHWKHYLDFTIRQDFPEHRIEVKGDKARFGIVRGGGVEYLLHAERRGDRLGWTETPAMQRLEEENTNDDAAFEVCALAPGTFALGLALHGFPLIRSDEDWAERHHSADGGDPEGLAYKIEIFEACDREEGFEVRTPRIPGISYRKLDEID